MSRLAYALLSLPVLLALLGGVQAGPACARRSQGAEDCIQRCADKWGWPGYVMGTDRWGSVISQSASSSEALVTAVTKACRASSSSASSSATASAQPTVAPANVEGSASLSTDISTPVSSTILSTSSSSTISKPAAFTHSSAKPLVTSSRSSTTSSSQAQSTDITSSTTPLTTSTTSEKPTTSNTPPTTSTRSTTSLVQTTTSEPPKTTIVKTTSKAAAQSSSTPAPSSGAGDTTSSSTSQSDINAYLTAHNSVRAQHGAADLTWSDNLAAAAQTWANKCVFQHSGGSLGPFGENLAAGTGDSYNIAAAVKSWTDEVSEYNPNDPQASHFTQVVWKSSTQVGCAVQECSGIFAASFGPAKFFVCEYSPAGNVIGQFPENVQV